MGNYSNEEWYLKEKEKYVILNHSSFFQITPYSHNHRMGFAMVFTNCKDNYKDERSKIDFFLRYPPPPRWMEIMACYLWDEVPMEDFEEYLTKIKNLGFTGTKSYLLEEDSKWLD